MRLAPVLHLFLLVTVACSSLNPVPAHRAQTLERPEAAPSAGPDEGGEASGFFELRRAAGEARQKGDLEAALELLTRVHRFGPQNPIVSLQLAEVLVQTGHREEALGHLRALVVGGVYLDLHESEALATLAGDPSFGAILEGLEANREPVARAKIVCRFDAPGLAPEGIDLDRKRRRVVLGSFSRGQLVSAGLDCVTQELTPAGTLGVVAGIRVDAGRDLVWATSNAEEGIEGVRPAVVAVRLDSGKVVARKELASGGAAVLLNDLEVTPDGAVYVTESIGGTLLRTCLDCPALEVFVPAGTMPGPNGVTAAGEGATLYVAHAAGISRVDSTTGAEDRLRVPEGEITVGADGLYWHEGTLVAVQNQPFHDRIVQLILDEAGREVVETRVLNARSPGGMFHSTGFLLDGRFYFNGVPGGLPAPAELQDQRPVLLAVPLSD